jgi:hypothetical protein
MRKHLLLYIFILSSFLSFGQAGKVESSEFEIGKFQPIPKEYSTLNRAYLIDKINPEIKYNYWEAVYKDVLDDTSRGKRIVYNGDSLDFSSYARKYESDNGFFLECHPGICFTYIIGVKDKDNVDIISTEDELKNFIGKIDNIEEVILISKANGLWFDTDTIIGGAYREREDDYLLYLLDYSGTPVTLTSVKVILSKTGSFRVVEKEIYEQDLDTYIIE